MTDFLDKEELAITIETKFHIVPMRFGIFSLVLIPICSFFVYDGAVLFAIVFFICALILPIVGLGLVKQYINENELLSTKQLQKLKTAKVICIIGLGLNILILILSIFFLLIVFSRVT